MKTAQSNPFSFSKLMTVAFCLLLLLNLVSFYRAFTSESLLPDLQSEFATLRRLRDALSSAPSRSSASRSRFPIEEYNSLISLHHRVASSQAAELQSLAASLNQILPAIRSRGTELIAATNALLPWIEAVEQRLPQAYHDRLQAMLAVAPALKPILQDTSSIVASNQPQPIDNQHVNNNKIENNAPVLFPAIPAPPPPPPLPLSSSSSSSSSLSSSLSASISQGPLPSWLPPLPPPSSSLPFSIDLPPALADDLLQRFAANQHLPASKHALHRWCQMHVAQQLQHLQHPESCADRPSLSFEVDKACGFGCQLHHTNHCFKKAISSGMSLQHGGSSNWRYAPANSAPCRKQKNGAPNGWECFFSQMSSCPLRGSSGNNRPVHCPITETARYGLEYFVPKELRRVVAAFHRDPPVWFAGQTEAFLMRPSDEFKGKYEAALGKIPKERPFASVHVRRTDKIGTEASLHSFKEYMDKLLGMLQRDFADSGGFPSEYALYVLSDEPRVISEVEDYFAGFAGVKPKIYYDQSSIKSGSTSTRSSGESLTLLLQDLIVASHSDYFVGTFSSQVSRLVYELMQSVQLDPFDRVKSLDDGWYYG